ncbi:MAG TPA: carboxypeptidase-like regulatory domain-containing protein [Gemmatimonadaceae bacterium]|nr:carboxypeptidase-like regulatory domain-containing protein [Gemmatimonadaceae bacterium]
MRTLLRAMFCAALIAAPALAQEGQGGTISGTVSDESGRPLAGAEVVAYPANARVRTDSAGHFAITHLGDGFYHVRARRIGYLAAEITSDLSKDGHLELKFELKPRPAMLDSVIVLADGKCPALHFGGFNCRKRFGKGVYLTDDDIADKGAVDVGDVFNDLDGFRVVPTPTPFGRKPFPYSIHGNRCLNALVNGKPSSLANRVPEYADELIGVEIYSTPSKVPEEYEQYVYEPRIRQTGDPNGAPVAARARCALVVYWTSFN